MNVYDMARACEPMEFDTPIIARMPDGTRLDIVTAKWAMNRKTDAAEIILDLAPSPSDHHS